ncbi:MAG TPA: winged helix-turn-helix transcriptional regulator [Nitrososphaera sp.]|nr:winged helix-turn-helix transcriptional regulator [Nitrososphaera sp.]
MDIKDFRLIAALHENARQSYRSLGRHISLSSPAVRDRLRRLQRLGILKGFWLLIDPGIFGRDNLLVFFRGEWTRKEALRALTVPEVAWVAWKMNGWLTVQLWPRDPKQALRALTGALGAREFGKTLGDSRRYHKHLATIDWQIIDALIDDPKLPFKQLCQSTELSPKTVRKHLEMLMEEEIIYILPRLGPLADSGEVVYHLAVFGPVSVSDLYQLMGSDDTILLNVTHNPPVQYLLCRSSSLTDVTTKTHALSNLPGVKSVVVDLNREIFVNTSFIHSLVRENISY